MKKMFLGSMLLLLVSAAVSAAQIESFTNIKINPLEASTYRAVVSVHLVWANPVFSQEDTLAARQAIAVALKSIKLRDYVVHDAIDIVKQRIQTYLSENMVVAENKVLEIYVTDLVVEYTGENKAFIRPAPSKNSAD